MGDGFPEVAWEHAATAFQVSTWSLASLTQACRPLFGEPASVVGLTFDASVAWPVYDWMGVAKAALESTSPLPGPRARARGRAGRTWSPPGRCAAWR